MGRTSCSYPTKAAPSHQPVIANVGRWSHKLAVEVEFKMCIEWDPKKVQSNLRKHKISYEETATALKDPMAATGPDPDHSIGEN